ncbi:MAG: helix-turn-helix transcriptional regulator [Cyanobacteriota bacterium]|nr:helix-turn-helix transcriptional regulator [Cyanobacteriota bacterium]
MSAHPFALRVVRWPRRFWPGASRQTPPLVTPPDPLRAAGQVLRESREAKGLRLRDLAERTRISIAVLEALERGWKDRLPEATYLRTMLPLLAQELDLPSGSLEAMLPVAPHEARGVPSGQGLVAAVFSPFTIHFLTRWQGTLLYGLLILGLLLAVNDQQRRLAALGHLTARPVPLVVVGTGESEGGAARQGLGAAPGAPPLGGDLHPLTRASTGVALDLLARESQRRGVDGGLGVLRLTLESPTRVDLRSLRGGDWHLEGLQGEIALPVLPPFALRLSPAPPSGAVRWRGQPLPAQTAASGVAPRPTGRASGRYAVPAR